jgi:hypothetical protein
MKTKAPVLIAKAALKRIMDGDYLTENEARQIARDAFVKITKATLDKPEKIKQLEFFFEENSKREVR